MYSAQRSELERKTRARAQDVWSLVVRHLRDLGHTVEVKDETDVSEFSLNGEWVYFAVVLEYQGGSRYHRLVSGRLRAKVGSYGDVRQFPEPKAGFNIPKLGAAVLARAKQDQLERQMRETHRVKLAELQAQKERLQATYGLDYRSNWDLNINGSSFQLVSRGLGAQEVEFILHALAEKDLVRAPHYRGEGVTDGGSR